MIKRNITYWLRMLARARLHARFRLTTGSIATSGMWATLVYSWAAQDKTRHTLARTQIHM